MSPKPILTVDALVMNLMPHGDGMMTKFLLIKRKNPPEGYALPGGLVDIGETVENAVVRELREETSLIADVDDVDLFCVRSEPDRDPRFHAVSLVYVIMKFGGEVKAADDAKEAGWFTYNEIQELPMAFDHKDIIQKYYAHIRDCMRSIQG